MFYLLTGSWLQYFRPCFAAFIYFLYSYIIIITLGMTVDLPQLIKINDKIIPVAKETQFNERFGSWINLRFIIIIRFLLGNRIYVSKLMRNLSMKRLTFSPQ